MSNFIFSRRSLQQTINQLAGVLQQEQLVSIVDRLNRPGDARLPAMWEIVMLDALARVGVLRHEIKLPNGRRPDIELTVSGANDEPFLIIGDVASVSDFGLDEQNPVAALGAELARLVTKAGLNPAHFGYDVPGYREGSYGDGRMKLSLPAKEQLLTLMRQEVGPWIRRLKTAPQQVDSFNYVEPGIRFSLTYDPNQLYARGGYTSYDVAVSRDKNPLFRALKGKASQLKLAPPTALRLIVACDGDCALLRQSTQMRPPGTLSAREVAEDFLRQNSSIDAVLLVTIDEPQQIYRSTETYQMRYDLIVAPRLTPVVITALDTVLREAVGHVPQPIQSAYNAAIRCREQGCGPDMIGGYEMSGNCVSLSSRALQRLLAGEITVKDFIEAHGWNDSSGPSNPFKNMARQGRMIAKIEVESAGNNDDDWLSFTFGSPDPAAAPFCVPPAENSVRLDDVTHRPLSPTSDDAC